MAASGTWDLSGSIEFDHCRDGGIEEGESYAFHTRRPFPIEQQGSALSGGVDRSSVAGTVAGNCITARVTDIDDAGNTATYDLSGLAHTQGGTVVVRITGSFTGQGPEGCSSEGEFQIDVDPP